MGRKNVEPAKVKKSARFHRNEALPIGYTSNLQIMEKQTMYEEELRNGPEQYPGAESTLKRLLLTLNAAIFVVACWPITSVRHDIYARQWLVAQGSPSAAITATFTRDGFTLRITARCEPAARLCPFRAEIQAPPALFDLIEHVEYTFIPDRRNSPSPVTDASTGFRLEANQTFGEKVYAAVTLRPRGGTPSKVVRLEGTIPFAADVKPPLPAGLRFEDQYQQQYLEGGILTNYYFFRIWLRGDAAALNRIRSVEYQLPQSHFSRPRVVANAGMEYMIDGTMLGDARFDIVALIRWKDARAQVMQSHFVRVGSQAIQTEPVLMA